MAPADPSPARSHRRSALRDPAHRPQLRSFRQYARLSTIFAADEHVAVKLAWVIYQKIITAYADPNRHRGKHAMSRHIASPRRPSRTREIAQLGRTLWRRH